MSDLRFHGNMENQIGCKKIQFVKPNQDGSSLSSKNEQSPNFGNLNIGSSGYQGSAPMSGFVRAGEGGKASSNGDTRRVQRDYAMPGSVNLARGAPSVPSTLKANPVIEAQEYQRLWKEETDPLLAKFRKLAWEVVSLKSSRPNAIDKIHSAANRVPTRIEFNTEPVFAPGRGRAASSFKCHVFMEGITLSSGQGKKIKDAKCNAYELALQKMFMPVLRVVQTDPESRELHGQEKPFTSLPPKPSSVPLSKTSAQLPPSASSLPVGNGTGKTKAHVSQHRESNLEAASVKRRLDVQRSLEDFVIVEPLIPIRDCTAAHTLRRSADFNHMLLEYEFFFQGESTRCILKIEGQVLADVNAVSKNTVKNQAAEQALCKLKQICWVIKTKQAVDSDTRISKDEILNELNNQSESIDDDNVGNRLLRKMGWSGGGVGKDGSGISEPVSLKSVVNREGLGLGSTQGITDEYKRRVREVIENYAASDNQEDLVFNCDFRLEERLIIHDECKRLNLRSKSKGKGKNRYLCVRRKRSANMLFDMIMSCGGETARYKLVPPVSQKALSAGNSNDILSNCPSDDWEKPVDVHRSSETLENKRVALGPIASEKEGCFQSKSLAGSGKDYQSNQMQGLCHDQYRNNQIYSNISYTEQHKRPKQDPQNMFVNFYDDRLQNTQRRFNGPNGVERFTSDPGMFRNSMHSQGQSQSNIHSLESVSHGSHSAHHRLNGPVRMNNIANGLVGMQTRMNGPMGFQTRFNGPVGVRMNSSFGKPEGTNRPELMQHRMARTPYMQYSQIISPNGMQNSPFNHQPHQFH